MMNRQILFLSIFLLLGLSLKANAGPADNNLIILKQPSGKTFKARLHGDERYNWITTKEGYGIYKNAANGNWEYYQSDNVSRLVVGEVEPSKFNIPKGLNSYQSVKKESIKYRNGNIDFGSRNSLTESNPVAGDRKLLVICVDFLDTAGTYDPLDIQPLFFGETSSVSDYYQKVSYSAVSISPASETSGVTDDGIIGWLHLPYKHPNTGDSTDVISDSTNQQIAKDAITLADPYINYASYDYNKDSTISTDELSIIIIVAGYERSAGPAAPSIWGHRWSMFSVGYPIVDSTITIEDYCEIGERHGDHLATIGIMAHELGHLIFSLPDLYDTNPGNGDSYGVGFFDLMGNGSWASKTGEFHGSMPTQLSAWSKEYLSWGKVTTIDSGQDITLPKTDSDGSSVFRVNTSDPDQYFLLENRQFSGYDMGFQRFEEASGHGGVVIYHIDNSKLTSSNFNFNDVNADVNDKGVDVEEADEGILGFSQLDTEQTPLDKNMFFFSGNNSDFTNDTIPGSRLKNNTHTRIAITGVSNYGDIMTAKISLVQQPVVKLTAEILSHSPWLVNFTADTTALDGDIIKYEWDFNGDDKYETTTTVKTLNFTYNIIGTYNVKVKVTYSDGAIAEAVMAIGLKYLSKPMGNIDTVSSGSADRVDGHDLYDMAKAFGSNPQNSNWNLYADLNEDLIIDGNDLALLAMNFGK
ncbi:MAG: M6 family metalloprotease domain-containing protein [bacterium]|nr:M6 family metalloprotease domain-containing protein [bacterium]